MAPSQHGRADAHFDAATIAAVQQVPVIKVGHLRYGGRLLSIVEWLPWWEEMQTLDDALQAALAPRGEDRRVDPTGVLRVIQKRAAFARRYLTVVFPRRRYPFYAPDPVAHLMAQPHETMEAALKFFFILQARATFGAEAVDAVMPPLPPTIRTAMPGTPSPDRTAPASVDGAP